MSIKFSPEDDVGKILLEWWRELAQDRGGRAELRRAQNETDVALTPVFQRLYWRLRPFMKGECRWEDRLAITAGLLSHVKEIVSLSLAVQMAGTKKDGPLVSELRFRRLLQKERHELLSAFIRIIRMLDGRVNIHDLATAVYYWGDTVKKQWAYAYFPLLPTNR